MHEILVYFKSGILEKNSNRFGLKQKKEWEYTMNQKFKYTKERIYKCEYICRLIDN